MGKATVIAGMAVGIAMLGVRAGAEAEGNAVPPAASTSPISKLAPLHGLWRGGAMVMAGGRTLELIHTERVGPMLGGTIEMIEGKSYNKDGSEAGFNALAVMSCAAGLAGCELRSYAQGRAGTFPLAVRDDGFDWRQPAGAEASIAYHAVVGNGDWHEEGWFEKDGKRLAKVYQADLKRLGDTDWPAAGPVSAR